MEATVELWGSSLAIRIPETIALQAKVSQDSPIDIELCDGKIVVTPLVRSQSTLDALLAQVTPENRHAEWQS